MVVPLALAKRGWLSATTTSQRSWAVHHVVKVEAGMVQRFLRMDCSHSARAVILQCTLMRTHHVTASEAVSVSATACLGNSV